MSKKTIKTVAIAAATLGTALSASASKNADTAINFDSAVGITDANMTFQISDEENALRIAGNPQKPPPHMRKWFIATDVTENPDLALGKDIEGIFEDFNG